MSVTSKEEKKAAALIEKSMNVPPADEAWYLNQIRSITADYQVQMNKVVLPAIDAYAKAEEAAMRELDEDEDTKALQDAEPDPAKKKYLMTLRARLERRIEKIEAEIERIANITDDDANKKVNAKKEKIRKLKSSIKDLDFALEDMNAAVAAMEKRVVKKDNEQAKKVATRVLHNVEKKTEAVYTKGINTIISIPTGDVFNSKGNKSLKKEFDSRVLLQQKLIGSLKPKAFESFKKAVADIQSGSGGDLRAQASKMIRREALRSWESLDQRAQLIASNELVTYAATVTELRNKKAGIKTYIWRTSLDGRVREKHRDREGKSFDYAKPPEGGNPGQDIRCRCTAQPDFKDVGWLNEDDDE